MKQRINFKRAGEASDGRFERIGNWVKNNRHVWLVLFWPLFLAAFFIIEKLVTAEYFVSYVPLDDYIPFCEYFVVFYCLWYPFLAVTTLYLLFRDAENFKRYMAFLMIGLSASLLICVIFPNGQDLRPDVFPQDNVFSRLVGLLYSADTNTNVLPSMHVVGCVAGSCALFRSRAVKRWAKIGSIILTSLIVVSTVFIKQHSVLDIYAAVALCVPIYLIVYTPWKKKKQVPKT